MKVQEIDYGPELKIKNAEVRRLANQRALLGDELKKLYDARFLLTSKILGLEDKQHQIETVLHQTQRAIFEIHDAARKEDSMSLPERMAKWMKEGKSNEEILQLSKRYT